MALHDGDMYGFPDQNAPDEVKKTKKYGNMVGNFIANEQFYKRAGVARFYDSRQEMQRLRAYARGAQNTYRYKQGLQVDGDDSYLNLDWEPSAILAKFVDIMKNGISDRLWDVNAYAQDDVAINKRRKDFAILKGEMEKKQELLALQEQTGIKLFENDPDGLPESSEELEIFTQLNYKQKVEIAAETTINQIFAMNRYEEVNRRVIRDIIEIGVGAAKHSFDPSKGVCLEYVDPADIVFSDTNDPNFKDIYYTGEVKRITVADLRQMFPDLTPAIMKKIRQAGANFYDYHGIGYEQIQAENEERREANHVEILFYSWKTVRRSVHKIRTNRKGGKTAVKKDEFFEGPKTEDAKFSKTERLEEVIYSGVKVLGDDDLLLKWELEKNMVRPKSSTHEVIMPMVISAPNYLEGRYDSMIKRITKYADMIHLTYLKIQQTLQKINPTGVAVNADAMVEIDLGNGQAFSPREAMKMFWQTGSIFYRTIDVDGMPNPNAIPIQELGNEAGVNKVLSLMQILEGWVEKIRQETGINEARDASDPDPRALVGVQKMLAANSNTATRHILDASLDITKKLAEASVLRMQDVLEFHPLRENFIMSIGKVNVTVIDSLKDMHLSDFGIFVELEPDDEEKQFLEGNIQQALAAQQIYLDDAIDVRRIKNLSLANQVLKFRRKKKHAEDIELQTSQAKAQSEAQAQAAQLAEQAKQQTEQLKAQLEQQRMQFEHQLAIQKLGAEKDYEKEILTLKAQLENQAASAEMAHDDRMADKEAQNDGVSVGLGNKDNTIDNKVKGAGYLQG